jgi:hypothetical protein
MKRLANLFAQKEISEPATLRNFRTVQKEGRREVAEKAVCRDFRHTAENAERYATLLPPCPAIAPSAQRRKLTGEVATLAARVNEHLKKMGAVWK